MFVVYHSSNAFAGVTGVSMLSLFENNKYMESIHVLYIEKGMTDENKNRLRSIANQYGRTLEFMTMPNWSEELNIELKSCKDGWLGFGYNRLFLTEYIPNNVDRVLYLDSDTIIEGSLDELWKTDVEDWYLAGVDDCLSSNYRDICEIGANSTYVNAGMLLINLKKWREENVIQKFTKYVTDNNGYFVFNEQSILNSIFSGKIKILPQEYNVNSLVYLFEYDELMRLRNPRDFSYTKDEFYNARKNPIITHFTGNFLVARRPWVENSDHPRADVYLRYHQLTPWANQPLMPCKKNKGSHNTNLCKKLPRRTMIFLVRILYNDLRPKVFKYQLSKQRADKYKSKYSLTKGTF